MASEYGWSKKDILEDVYFDELFNLTNKINRRKIADYKMQLAIAQNPHVKDPKSLWKVLEQQSNQYEPEQDQYDRVGLQMLKQRMSSNPRIVVK